MSRRTSLIRAVCYAVEPLECRTLLAAVSWTGAAGDNKWTSPGNWSGNAVPGPNDDVTIDVAGNPTIGLSSNQAVGSLTTAENVQVGGVQGGRDVPTASLSVANGLTLMNNVNVSVSTNYSAFGVTGGSVLYVGGTIHGQGSVSFSGSGSRNTLVGSNLTIGSGVTIGAAGGSAGLIQGSIVNEGLITGGSSPFFSVAIQANVVNNGTIGRYGVITLDTAGYHPGTGVLESNIGTVGGPGATIILTGQFTQASLGKIRGRPEVPGFVVSGTLTGGLFLDKTIGSWAFDGGTMSGGFYRGVDGAYLEVRGAATFDGVSVAGDMQVAYSAANLIVKNDLELVDNPKIRIFDGGVLEFRGGHQNLIGDGELVFGPSYSPKATILCTGSAADGPASLSIEAGVTIRSNAVEGSSADVGQDDAQTSITHHGQLVASSGRINVHKNFRNHGTVRVEGGGIINFNGAYGVPGSFDVRGGALNLGGAFTQAQLGTLTHAGGRVVITGTLTGGLALDATTGSWEIKEGKLVGGTYTASGGAVLQVVFSYAQFDGVTVAADLLVTNASLLVTNNLTLANNAKITLSSTDPVNQFSMVFLDDSTLSGQGEIVFAGAANERPSGLYGGSLAIGPGVTIRGQGGNATLGGPDTSIINQGVIVVERTGAALEVLGSFTNEGVVRLTNGTLKIDDANSGTGAGAFDIRGGTLSLDGSFTQAGLGQIAHTGGAINLIGTITGGLALNAATGSVNLVGGKLAGGTYSATGGARLRVTAGSKFDGMTAASDLDVVGSVVGVTGNLTLASGAVVHLIAKSGAAASLDFRDGNQTLGGTGEARFEGPAGGGSTIRAVRYTDNAAASVTIGSGVTVRGDGVIGGGGRLTSVANAGVVAAEGAGRTITLKDTFSNTGSTLAGSGASLAAAGQFSNVGLVALGPGAAFAVAAGGAFNNTSSFLSHEGVSLAATGQFTNAGDLTLGPGTVFTIGVGGSFSNTGTVTFQIGGSPQDGLFGRINSNVALTLGGTANIQLIGDFLPAAGDVYPLVQASAVAGAFDVVNGLVVDGVTRFTQSLSAAAFTVTATGQVPPMQVHVIDVFVSGAQWTASFLQGLTSRGLGDSSFGYRLSSAQSALSNLPWTNLDRVSVRFDRPVSVESADLSIAGVRAPTLAVASFGYEAASHTATWTFAAPLGGDAIVLDLNAAAGGVAAADGGRALDGDYLGQLPTGDGADGGDFRLRLNVLPADVNQSGGSINAADVVLTRNRVGRTAADGSSGAAAYSVFNDLNGDGVINASDLVQVRNRVGTALPSTPGFNYPTFGSAAGLDFFGDAAQAGDTLRLVPASEHHNGAVRRQGVQNLSQGFSTSFTFGYAKVGGILDDAGNHGTDGIAFTIQPAGSGTPVLAGGGLSIWFDAYRDGSDVSSSRVGVYRDGALVTQFDVEALDIRYREGAAHTAQIDSSGSAIAIRLDGHLLGQVAANVGGSGLVGFAGFAGQAYADQELSNWSFRPTALSQPAVVVGDGGRIIAPPRKGAVATLIESGELA